MRISNWGKERLKAISNHRGCNDPTAAIEMVSEAAMLDALRGHRTQRYGESPYASKLGVVTSRRANLRRGLPLWRYLLTWKRRGNC